MLTLKEMLEQQKKQKEESKTHAASLETAIHETKKSSFLDLVKQKSNGSSPLGQASEGNKSVENKGGNNNEHVKSDVNMNETKDVVSGTGDTLPRPPSLAKSPVPPATVDAKEFQHDAQPKEFSEEEVQTIKESLDLLANNLENKELVGQMIYTITQQLRANPNLCGILAPEDMGTMVRGLRISYQKVITKKGQRREKKQEIQEDVNEFINFLQGQEIDLSGAD